MGLRLAKMHIPKDYKINAYTRSERDQFSKVVDVHIWDILSLQYWWKINVEHLISGKAIKSIWLTKGMIT